MKDLEQCFHCHNWYPFDDLDNFVCPACIVQAEYMGQWDNTYPIPFEDELYDAYDGKIKGVSISWE